MFDKKLAQLWTIIEKEKIKVLYADLLSARQTLMGVYFMDKTGPVIILDNTLKTCRRLCKCVLAEEIGHFYTAPRSNFLVAYMSYGDKINLSRDERNAMQYATSLLIPDRELAIALRMGYRECFELAEYFDVTGEFIQYKLSILKT